MSKNIVVIVGSLRKESYNLKIAKVLQQVAPSSLSLNIIKIDDLPIYNEDIDHATPPETYTRFRKELSNSQGVIFVTPEYNRGLPAALKNAIDVGSRPYGKSVWTQKPAAVFSSSVGPIGGYSANHQLRQSLVVLDMPVMQQPEAYFGTVASSFDEQGHMVQRGKEFLTLFITAYAAWVEKFK